MRRSARKFRRARLVLSVLSIAVLSACADYRLPDWIPQERVDQPTEQASPLASTTGEALSETSSAQSEAATLIPATPGRTLGTTVATLGNATEPGFWLKTPLTDAAQPGVVRSRDTGARVTVQLIPLEGPATAGSQLSLAAMRELGLSLTALAELDVSIAG